jgi:endonuclease/exonuclease/phosphatase family metal-dependent hydrolase
MELRVGTINIGGGEKSFEEFPQATQKSRQEALAILVSRLDATLLCLQEVSEYIDPDGKPYNLMDGINQAGNYDYSFFGKTVSMESNLQVQKDVMVKGIFNDWRDWSKGNAIHAKYPFASLLDPLLAGTPRNIPIYQPPVYEGTRNTEPRFVLLTRLKEAPYPFVATLHLTTLVDERHPQAHPDQVEKAVELRRQQVERFINLVRVNILEEGLPLILAGDFNAPSDEACIQEVLISKNGFVRLVPEDDGPSHSETADSIDHILFFPEKRLLQYHCWIEANGLSRKASDHLPVVADLKIK